METTTYHIDAAGKRLGRIATEAATYLMGKARTDMVRHMVAPVEVVISNANQLMIDDRKRTDKVYIHYTGHPDGLRRTTLTRLIEKKGVEEAVRRAIYGMLPHNRLRAQMMKRLTITA